MQISLDVFRMSSFFPGGSRQSFRLGEKTELLNETQEKGRNKQNCEKVVVSPTFLCCTLQNISSFLKKHTYLKGRHVIHTAVTMTYSLSKPASVAGRQRWSRQLVLWEVSKIRALILWAAWLSKYITIDGLWFWLSSFGVWTTSSWCVLRFFFEWKLYGMSADILDIQTGEKTHIEEPKIEASPCTIGWTDCVDCYPSVWWFSFCEWPGRIWSKGGS